MESLFDFLRMLEFRPRLLDLRVAQESFEQNRRFFVRHPFLVFARDR
jgi:hypothetical protein